MHLNVRLLDGDTEQGKAKVEKSTDDASELGLLKEGGDEDDEAKDRLGVHQKEGEDVDLVRVLKYVDAEYSPGK